MKRLKVKDSDFGTREFKRFFEKYVSKKGYSKKPEDMPQDLLQELLIPAMLCFTAKDLSVGEEFVVTAHTLDFWCIKQGRYSLQIKADKLLDTLGIDPESPEGQARLNPNNSKYLSPDEEFYHPLTEVTVLQGKECVNSYGFASMAVNTLRNPKDTKDNGKTLENNLRKILFSRGAQAEYLIEKIKVGDIQSIYKLCTLVNDHFEEIARKEGN